MNTHDNFTEKPITYKVWAKFLVVMAMLILGILGLAVGLLFIQTENGTAPLQLIREFLALDSIHIWWYVSRASGLMGYLLLWFSMIWGFAVSSKIFDSVLERVFTYDFHEHLSLLSLGFVGVHSLALLFDQVEPLSLIEVLFPFMSSYRPFWTGIGILAFYLSVLVTVTFYLRSRISIKTFRKIHYFSIAAYAGSLFHSLYSGTDSALTWVQWMYWGTFLSTIFFLVYWLVSLALQKRINLHRDRIQREYQS